MEVGRPTSIELQMPTQNALRLRLWLCVQHPWQLMIVEIKYEA